MPAARIGFTESTHGALALPDGRRRSCPCPHGMEQTVVHFSTHRAGPVGHPRTRRYGPFARDHASTAAMSPSTAR